MNIADRIKNILMTPKTEWTVIANEPADPGQILMTYVLPLAAIPFVGHLLNGLIGPLGLTYGIAMGLVQFLSALVSVYLVAFIVDILAPNFGSEKNFGRSVQLVAYSYTPGWVAGILYAITSLSILVTIASLYGLYLMYVGLPPVKKTPQDKQVVYLVVIIIAVIIVSMILAAILGAIILGIFGLGALTGAMGMH
jgi:hypothetical protein